MERSSKEKVAPAKPSSRQEKTGEEKLDRMREALRRFRVGEIELGIVHLRRLARGVDLRSAEQRDPEESPEDQKRFEEALTLYDGWNPEELLGFLNAVEVMKVVDHDQRFLPSTSQETREERFDNGLKFLEKIGMHIRFEPDTLTIDGRKKGSLLLK